MNYMTVVVIDNSVPYRRDKPLTQSLPVMWKDANDGH